MILFQKIISRDDLRSNPGVLYVFGDNEIRQGYGGQAGEMRGEPNAVGVATLFAPGRLWREDDAARQKRVIDRDLTRVVRHLLLGRNVVWPRDGIGTGLARLHVASPSTLNHIGTRLQQLVEMKPFMFIDTWENNTGAFLDQFYPYPHRQTQETPAR
jgi:hypothetical protein